MKIKKNKNWQASDGIIATAEPPCVNEACLTEAFKSCLNGLPLDVWMSA